MLHSRPFAPLKRKNLHLKQKNKAEMEEYGSLVI